MLRLGGRIVLSDFTKKGFEMIDMIHRSEGRQHAAHPSRLINAKGYLKGRNLGFEEYSSEYQEVLIIHKK